MGKAQTKQQGQICDRSNQHSYAQKKEAEKTPLQSSSPPCRTPTNEDRDHKSAKLPATSSSSPFTDKNDEGSEDEVPVEELDFYQWMRERGSRENAASLEIDSSKSHSEEPKKRKVSTLRSLNSESEFNYGNSYPEKAQQEEMEEKQRHRVLSFIFYRNLIRI
jgi:hypothetical protein